MWGHGLDSAGSGQGQVVSTCECGNEHSGSIKCGEFLDWVRTGQLLKKDCAPQSQKVSEEVKICLRQCHVQSNKVSIFFYKFRAPGLLYVPPGLPAKYSTFCSHTHTHTHTHLSYFICIGPRTRRNISPVLYTRSVRKVSDRIFLCEHLMDYNLARLHEPTLNLSAHA